jgi:hypothetical protein
LQATPLHRQETDSPDAGGFAVNHISFVAAIDEIVSGSAEASLANIYA